MGRKTPVDTDACASVDQIESAISHLSEADAERLYRSATWRARGLTALGLSIGADDLVHEAMRLALEGGRRWPMKIPFVRYLLQLVRNVAGHVARSHRTGRTVDPQQKRSAARDPALFVGAGPPDPERIAIAREVIGRLKERFAADELVTAIIAGFESEMNGSDLRRALDLSQRDYETAVARLRRGARMQED